MNAAFFGAGGGELQDGSPADTALGEVDTALASAAVSLDATYTTPIYHHNPMEPHTAVATWTDDGLTIYCSSQGVHTPRNLLASAFGLDPARIRLISPWSAKTSPRTTSPQTPTYVPFLAMVMSALEAFRDHHNANATPFKWTATAESILEKVQRLCQAISGT